MPFGADSGVNPEDAADHSLRLVTEHMERTNQELDVAWQRQRADYYESEMIKLSEMTAQRMTEAEMFFQEQSMVMCQAAANSNRENVARVQEEVDEQYQVYIAWLTRKINEQHAENREQLLQRGREDVQRALKAQQDAFTMEYAVEAKLYESIGEIYGSDG